MNRRFIVVVLDGFGIGAMEDAHIVRPGDEKANTLPVSYTHLRAHET